MNLNRTQNQPHKISLYFPVNKIFGKFYFLDLFSSVLDTFCEIWKIVEKFDA